MLGMTPGDSCFSSFFIDSRGIIRGDRLARVSYSGEIDSSGYHTLGRLTCLGFIPPGEIEKFEYLDKCLTKIEKIFSSIGQWPR